MEIRFAEVGEAEAVCGVVLGAFEEFRGKLAVPLSGLSETVEDTQRDVKAGRVLVAVDGGAIVGTVRYEVNPDHVYVGRLAVLPAYRGRGVGAALMGYVEGLAPGMGQTRIRLATRQSLPGNLVFYEKLGYRVAERLAHERGPDIVVLFEKDLGDQT